VGDRAFTVENHNTGEGISDGSTVKRISDFFDIIQTRFGFGVSKLRIVLMFFALILRFLIKNNGYGRLLECIELRRAKRIQITVQLILLKRIYECV